jgi:hypothetical protein
VSLMDAHLPLEFQGSDTEKSRGGVEERSGQVPELTFFNLREMGAVGIDPQLFLRPCGLTPAYDASRR